MRWISVTLIAVLAGCVDRFSKLYFVHHSSDQINVIGQWVILQYHLNLAMALSLPLFPILYYTLTIVIVAILAVQGLRSVQQHKFAEYVVILFILVGAMSNLVDRFIYGGVVDFITVWLGSVFNLADVFIVCAVLIWLAQLTFSPHISPQISKGNVQEKS